MAEILDKGTLNEEELNDIMAQIEQMLEIMEEIYQKNMLFFKKNYKDIYKLAKKEAKKILKDKEKEIFAIELNKEGSVDIISRLDNSYFYNTDPWILGDEIANELKGYKKIAFIGTGLGTHIISTVKFNKPKKILICEKDIQIFRTSMYVVDYEELSKITKIDFQIAQDKKCKTKKYDKVYELKI